MPRVTGLATVLTLASFLAAQPTPQPAKVPVTEAEKKAKELSDYIRASYTKHEAMVPMRDGVRLFTSVYAPKGTTEQYPVLLNRTPYTVAPYGVDNYRAKLGHSEKYAREGFIFVYQDVRGKGRSEGQFVHVRPHNPGRKSPADTDESTDTYDTVEWLLKHFRTSGSVGMYGISYPGFYAAHGAIDAHPAMKAVSPQAPVSEWFIGDDFRHNGALFLAHAFRFLSAFGQNIRPTGEPGAPSAVPFNYATPDGYEFYLRTGALQNFDERFFKGGIDYWKELIENDTYSPYWQARNLRQYLKGVKPAVMTVGGWFDAEDLFGALRVYEAIEKQSPGAKNSIVMGPWHHGGWAGAKGDRLGAVRFGSNTSNFYLDEIEFPFFLFHLKGKGNGNLAEAWMFETGRNEWHRHETWPPRESRPTTLYFGPGGKLDSQVPVASADAFDEYTSDPNKPVPYLGEITQNMDPTYMLADQRFASTRPDVLVYQTEPLDSDLRVAGPIKVNLHVSTTGSDSDFVVKVIDVYPGDFPDVELLPGLRQQPGDVIPMRRMGGYQQLVRGEPFRGKFRNSFEKPEPFTPGRVEKIEFELPDIYHAFRRGHRIMVHVQSSWFPLVDRNPQKFMKISDAKADDFGKATQRVYRSGQTASRVQLQVLP
ncbi:MAG TPA: CocE/NonD family hydrolase [Bryobacteraceae bacterium]|nr:CocE/NonD family hydrolase [Bryobacteraceae bacterium]